MANSCPVPFMSRRNISQMNSRNKISKNKAVGRILKDCQADQCMCQSTHMLMDFCGAKDSYLIVDYLVTTSII